MQGGNSEQNFQNSVSGNAHISSQYDIPNSVNNGTNEGQDVSIDQYAQNSIKGQLARDPEKNKQIIADKKKQIKEQKSEESKQYNSFQNQNENDESQQQNNDYWYNFYQREMDQWLINFSEAQLMKNKNQFEKETVDIINYSQQKGDNH